MSNAALSLTPAACGILFVALVAAGCPRSSPGLDSSPPPPTPSTSAAPLPSAAPAVAAPAVQVPTLIVAGEKGLQEVGYDGTVLRTLSRTRARSPRLLEGGKDIVFYAPAAGEVRVLSRETGVERRITALPGSFAACRPEAGTVPRSSLSIQEDSDFVVDPASGAVCMTLMDRNANMADVAVHLRIDLAKGTVVHHVAIGGDCLPKTREVGRCATPPETPRSGKSAPLALGSLGVPAATREESVSPSGHWSVVSLAPPEGEGDYLHRWVFLADRSEKALYPIAEGRFPRALDAAKRATLDASAKTLDVVAETPVRWLDQDALLVGSLLVVPGRGGVELGGEVAR